MKPGTWIAILLLLGALGVALAGRTAVNDINQINVPVTTHQQGKPTCVPSPNLTNMPTC